MASVGTVVIEVDANIAKLVEGMKKANSGISNLEKTANNAKRTLDNVAKAAATLFVGDKLFGLAKQVTAMADSYKLIEGRLSLVAKSTSDLISTQKELFSLSQETRQSYEATSDLYTRMARASKTLGKSQEELVDITKLVNQAMVISGASAQSSQAAIVQLGQALGSGRLQGDELRSIAENAPRLAQAIADGMGVAIGELKQLGADGALTANVVMNALQGQADILNTEFGKMPKTVGQATTMISNSMLQLVGAADKAFGASGSIASSLSAFSSIIADNIGNIVKLLDNVKFLVVSIAGATLAWKTQSLIVNPLIGAYKSLEFGATSLTGKYIALSFGLKTLYKSIKSFALANLPFLALTAAFEAWNYVTDKASNKQAELATVIGLTTEEVIKQTRAQQLNTLSKLNESISLQKESLQNAREELAVASVKRRLDRDSYIEAMATVDTEKQKLETYIQQKNTVQGIVDGTITSGEAATVIADKAGEASNNLADAANSAYKLANALSSAIVGMDTQLIKAQEIAGKITEAQSVSMVANVELKDIDRQMLEINKLYDAKGANIDELNTKAIEAYTKELSLQNGLAESLKSIEEKKRSEAKKTEKAYSSAASQAEKQVNKQVKSLEDAVKAADNLYIKFLELTGNKDQLFMIDIDKQMSDMMKLFEAGKITAEQVGEAYNAIWDKEYIERAKDANKEIALDFTQQFDGLFQGLINGDLGGAIKGLFSGISMEMSKNLISSLSDSISSKIGSMFGGLGDLGNGLIGLGIGLLGSLFGGDKEQTPPILDDMAKTSDSMSNALDYIKNAQNPMLSLTREMAGYLNSISKAFGGIENSLLRSGLDLGGASYQGTAKAGFLGLTSKSTELFGTSIQVGATTLSGIMNGWINATLLETTKTVKKGIFKSSTTYNTTGKDISTQLASYLDEAVTAAFQSLTISGEALGISTAGLANQSINIGSFDTTGMSASEVAAQLESRFSAQMDAIAESYFGVVSEFQLAGEGLAETLYRVTVNFEQVGHSLGLIDKSVNWRTANIIADYAGGIDALNSSLSSYQQNFFSEQEQYDMQVQTMTKNFASLGLALPTTNAQFRALIESLDTTTDGGAKTFAELIGLADGFAEMTSAGEELAKALDEMTISITDMIKQVSEAWLGNLSYLTISQKAEYASGYLAIASQSNGTIDTVEAARLAAETALKATSTKEEYIPIFDRYIQEIEAQAPEATTDDVVAQLKILIDRVEKLEETTRQVAV